MERTVIESRDRRDGRRYESKSQGKWGDWTNANVGSIG
jgi:hypothetical protein